MTLKFTNITMNRRKRKQYKKNEIFFNCCTLLTQSQFSNRLNYYFFKRRKVNSYFTKLRNACLISGYNNSVISRFRLSRHMFSKNILSATMPGFYKSVW